MHDFLGVILCMIYFHVVDDSKPNDFWYDPKPKLKLY